MEPILFTYNIISYEKERFFLKNFEYLQKDIQIKIKIQFSIRLPLKKHCFSAKKRIKLGESKLFCEKRTRAFND